MRAIHSQSALNARRSAGPLSGRLVMLRVCTVFAIAVAGIAAVSTNWTIWQFFVCLAVVLGWCVLTGLALAMLFRWRDVGRAKLGKLLYRSRGGVDDRLPAWTRLPMSLQGAMIYAARRLPATMAVMAFFSWCVMAAYFTHIELWETIAWSAVLNDYLGVLAFLVLLWGIQVFSLFVAIARPIGLEFYSNGFRTHGIGGVTWDMVTSTRWAEHRPGCLQVHTSMPRGGGWMLEFQVPADEQPAIDELLERFSC